MLFQNIWQRFAVVSIFSFSFFIREKEGFFFKKIQKIKIKVTFFVKDYT